MAQLTDKKTPLQNCRDIKSALSSGARKVTLTIPGLYQDAAVTACKFENNYIQVQAGSTTWVMVANPAWVTVR